MSVANLLGDIFSGNFTNAGARIKDWWSGVAPSVKVFINKVETDEGKILTGLAEVGAEDVLAGGLTTASFTAAAADIESKLISQNITMAKTDIFAAINIAVSAKNTPAAVVPPVPPAAA